MWNSTSGAHRIAMIPVPKGYVPGFLDIRRSGVLGYLDLFGLGFSEILATSLPQR